MRSLKRWLVLRWLYVIEPDELVTLGKDQQLRRAFNKWHKEASQLMIDTYFKHYHE